MSFAWSSTTLHPIAGSWQPYQNQAVLVETQLLPDPADIDAVCTVIQQAGRSRYRVKAKLLFSAMSEYTTLLSAKAAGTAATLSDGTISASYYIESISPPTEAVPGIITADIVFVEG